ncbi:phenylalanyl-tRNA synthetase beta chain [Culex quinquefasciatus]|uniref:Phenylalanyl-tRNA synthetase beta chain n=1 Tax=Culex quinquefasciatus TaxID=7176 RepID=B0X5F2_CULQU|nr:phenylalanyl-tRNA synthetase beta chain [Culex quinquefasciatus]|eukprot:XP_001864874.1 phenylalanyl-tRNA synthetase beta chain [Culex quinquefasciatus]
MRYRYISATHVRASDHADTRDGDLWAVRSTDLPAVKPPCGNGDRLWNPNQCFRPVGVSADTGEAPSTVGCCRTSEPSLETRTGARGRRTGVLLTSTERKLCFEFALELDEVTTEKQMIRTDGCGQGCENGLVQGLQVKEFPEFKKVASAKGPPQKLIVTEATKQFWPFALKAYFPIIRDSPVYPIVYDANGVVFSLPPIINGDHSKIGTTLVQNPDLAFRKETILTAKANVYIGIDESAEALTKMLNRLFPTTQKASNQLEVLNPPTRHDMLHVCDIEDVGAYGYNRIPKTLPATMHIARQCPLNKLTKQLHIEKTPAVHIANPKTLEFQVVRTSLIPGLPRKCTPRTRLPQLLPISALREPRFEELYPDRFPSARRRLRNLQFCACYSRIRVVHLVSRNALAEQIFMDWHQKFDQNSGCKPFLDCMANKTLKELLGHVEKYLESRTLAWVLQRPTKIRTIRWWICITRIRNGFRHQRRPQLELHWTGVQRRSVNQRC